MTDKPIREVFIQETPVIKERGGYRGGAEAATVPPPQDVPTGSLQQPQTQPVTIQPQTMQHGSGQASAPATVWTSSPL